MSGNASRLQLIVDEKIDSLNLNSKSIVVVKGVPLSMVGITNVDLSSILENKMGYFINNIISVNRKIIAYEEFLLLSQFILAQYEKVYILNNNIYIDYYPIEQLYSDTIKNGLLAHFDNYEDNRSDDVVIGDIAAYIEIYDGLKEDKGILFGSFCDYNQSNIKIEHVDLLDTNELSIPTIVSDEECFNIKSEEDYLDFLRLFLSTDEQELYINISDCLDDSADLIRSRLSTIYHYWEDLCDLVFVEKQEEASVYKTKPEFKEILKRFWGYDSFKTIKNYKLSELEKGNKEIIDISQEQIIAELVEQVENCKDTEKDYSDMFVTAPTGAGKSVMFQIPAIYLAEKYNLMTIVISPLIGLMNDQVKSLELKNCNYAKTINSDISPILRTEITEKVANGEYHILYISPETLLARSDVENLIGDRTIGMIVVDEAHIVTTWGKQFRPDYWYLGEHIQKLRKKQIEKKGVPFVVSTFTATAIYGGEEDMFRETNTSLKLTNTLVHLGYVKRNDINIVIKKHERIKDKRDETQLEKLKKVEGLIKRALITNKKTLIYFPTVELINRTITYLVSQKMMANVTYYYGPLDKDKKAENYEQYLKGEKLVMLATKAFGMGIDINNIEIVSHYAPTGNVCDYVQEIGRAARRPDISGEANYPYHTSDFQYINRMHGLSAIKEIQLVDVISKIYELYQNKLKNGEASFTRKRNSMLIDAENFSYIFRRQGDQETDVTNKVKTALLLIQKDFEKTYGFSPINTRPIPVFALGYFKIEPNIQKNIKKRFGDCITIVDEEKKICLVNLEMIWKKGYDKYSFPKFKYFIYSGDKELDFNQNYPMIQALCVEVEIDNDSTIAFEKRWNKLKAYITQNSVRTNKFIDHKDIVKQVENVFDVNYYKAASITDIMISSIGQYMRADFNKAMTGRIMRVLESKDKISYQFQNGIPFYFDWVKNGLFDIKRSISDGKFYITSDKGTEAKEFNIILGILESMKVLEFNMIGGANSQIYIYVNQVQRLQNIKNNPNSYKNKLLREISNRHKLSVTMLTYLYENDFSSDDRWELIENYFLGNVPREVQAKYELIKE